MRTSSWKKFAQFAGFGVLAGSGSTLAYIYATDERNKRKILGNITEKNEGNYWDSFGKSTLHQGIRKWNEEWDLCENEKEESVKGVEKPKVSRNLILIRHGHYNLDAASDKEKFLTDLGIKQAEYTADRLLELKIPITSIVCSTKLRAQQTAKVLKEKVPNSVRVFDDDADLNEGTPYPIEPYLSHLGKRYLIESTYEREGIRIERAFNKYFRRPTLEQEETSFELIVCHANVIRYFVLRALQLPPEAWIRMSLKHSSITWIKISSDGYCTVHAVGEASHIPPELLSSSKNVIKYVK